jgi:hypothetical protein
MSFCRLPSDRVLQLGFLGPISAMIFWRFLNSSIFEVLNGNEDDDDGDEAGLLAVVEDDFWDDDDGLDAVALACALALFIQHRLNFCPLLQGHGSLGFVFVTMILLLLCGSSSSDRSMEFL